MRELARIAALYEKLDAAMEADRMAAFGSARARVEADQILNDQAYFLLGRGQLETEINTVCRAAIKRRSTSMDWQVRRALYLYNPDDKRLSGLSFEDRAALVLDRTAGRGSPYANTISHYETRNNIAHGKLEASRLDVTGFVQDCFTIQSALHRAS